MLQDLQSDKHEIVVSNRYKALYGFDKVQPIFEDYKKVLFHKFLSKTNYVLDLPWVALTQAQMIEVAKEKCPGLTDQKIWACGNLPGFLCSAIKQSAEYVRLPTGLQIDRPWDIPQADACFKEPPD